MTSRHQLGAPALALATAALGCAQARLDRTLAEARPAVEAVRPEVSLADVRVEAWGSAAHAEALGRRSHEPLSHAFVRRVLEAQRPVFRRLGLEPALDVLISAKIDPATAATPAFVVPEEGLIVARTVIAGNLRVFSHELGHLASWRRGYWDVPASFLWLAPGHTGDPAWIDLDAFLAGWAVEEGAAELNAACAEAERRGEDAPADLVARTVAFAMQALNPGILGPLSLRVEALAYGNGLRFVAARSDADAPLETRLTQAWTSFHGSSLEILFPERTVEPSPLAARLRGDLATLDPAPRAATRLGAFLTFEVLSERRGYEVAGLLPVVQDYRDDLFLRWPEGDLWISDWTDAAAAQLFADLFRADDPDASVAVDGARVELAWGVADSVRAGWLGYGR